MHLNIWYRLAWLKGNDKYLEYLMAGIIFDGYELSIVLFHMSQTKDFLSIFRGMIWENYNKEIKDSHVFIKKDQQESRFHT